jgi:hypothetical protein
LLGKKNNSKIGMTTTHDVQLEQREIPEDNTTNQIPMNRIGTIGLGYHTASLAWPKMEWVLRAGGPNYLVNQDKTTGPKTFDAISRTPNSVLDDFPVDLLVVDSVKPTDYVVTGRNRTGESPWQRRV